MRKNIFRVLFILLATLIVHVSYAQQNTRPTHAQLKKFKRGNFMYTNGAYKGVLVKRTRHRQYEYDNAIHRKVVLKIKWVSDSVYILTYISDTQPARTPVKNAVIKTTITSVTNDSYTCHWVCDQFNSVGDSSFKKI